MDKGVIERLNIEHFHKRLKTEADEGKRRTILSLLAEEEAKLAALINPTKKTKDRANPSVSTLANV